jgi:hypothetical protein
MKDTVESVHMNHPDFRVRGKIFATLKHDLLSGMVALTPDQQEEFIGKVLAPFSPESGAGDARDAQRFIWPPADEESGG